MFDWPVTSLQDIKDDGNDVLKLLTDRSAAISQLIMNENAHYPVENVLSLPHISDFTGDDDLQQ